MVDLSLPTLVDTAGAAAFIVLGLLALAFRGPWVERALLATLLVAFGARLVVANLWGYGGPVVSVAVLALGVPGGVAGIALGHRILREAAPRDRAAWLLFTLLWTGQLLFQAFASAETIGRAFGMPPDEALRGGRANAFSSTTAGLAIVFFATGLRAARAQRDGPARWGALGFAVSAYVLFNTARLVGFAGVLPAPYVLVPAFLAILATLPWMRADPRVHLAMLAVGAAGLVVGFAASERGQDLDSTFGLGGVVRVVAAYVLARALLHGEVLGILPPHGAARGAPVAVALAALLIVAQVAQNFLSANFGLLVGGIVAGALLVAARPIERALDRRGPQRTLDAAARERSFRAAARRFYRTDGALTREEERDLMVLAEHLGVPIGRAYEIRDEMEKERRGPDSPRA